MTQLDEIDGLGYRSGAPRLKTTGSNSSFRETLQNERKVSAFTSIRMVRQEDGTCRDDCPSTG